MENASKALVIAGAILIAILLISVGILIINSTGSVTDQVGSQVDTMAIQAFNSQFISYEGSGKTAAQVRQLINTIESHNVNNELKIGYYVFVRKDISGNEINLTQLLDMKRGLKKLEYRFGTANNNGNIDITKEYCYESIENGFTYEITIYDLGICKKLAKTTGKLRVRPVCEKGYPDGFIDCVTIQGEQ